MIKTLSEYVVDLLVLTSFTSTSCDTSDQSERSDDNEEHNSDDKFWVF